MFEKIQKNFGFGAMRLPMAGEQVDIPQLTQMVDLFMESGFNYFDTAHIYLGGQSETALRECLVKRYPRESFVLTDKLSTYTFDSQADIRPRFQRQLEACGVEYFDFYLMHSQYEGNYPKFTACRAYETALELKAEGKIRHVGFSFHGTPALLEQILTEHPEMEVVQLQFNYLDMEADSIQSRACYEICCKHQKPVIVMEPVKGGKLAILPEEAKQVLAPFKGGSDASYAIRYAASFPGVMMVLSGMSNLAMVEDNCGYMKDFKPLSRSEEKAVETVRDILLKQASVGCTGCRYCTEVCPQRIPIPEVFSCLEQKRLGNWVTGDYKKILEKAGVKPADCIGCGACEKECPQHLPIRKLLEEVTAVFSQ